MPEIEVVNLTKRFGDIVAVNDISFRVEDGEYVCIIGPSGCGKTTLIKCIAGILKPDEGMIYMDGKPITDLPIQDRNIGYVFQEIALFPHQTVYENISYGPLVKGWQREKTRNIVREMLDMLRLEGREDSYPNELSGGARQKTAIGRALASGSFLLLLDEPLGALDAKVREVLRFELRKLVKDLGLTAIHVTHDQEEALAVSDRIIIMRGGRIVEVASPKELYLRPKRIFTTYFLGETNLLVGEMIKEKGILKIGNNVLEVNESLNLDTEKVIVSIRPEFISIVKGQDNPINRNCWKCKVSDVVFAGNIVRYHVKTEDGLELLIKRGASQNEGFERGDEIKILFPPEAINIYPYPRDGLEKEIALE